MKKDENELEIIDSAKKGDNKAFAKLLKRYKVGVYFMIYGMVNNITIAEDLTMESFEKAFKNIHTFTPDYKVSTWLYRIARNHTIDHIKANVNKPKFTELDIDIHDYGYNPEQTMIMKENTLRLESAVNGLKKKYKDIYTLRDEGCSYEEIATKMNIPIGTVKARLNRVRKQLEDKHI